MDLVTGGTGFVGAHLVRALLAEKRAEGASDVPQVRCLTRRGSDRENLAGLSGVEFAEGDLLDPESLSRAVDGCARVFHCAADYRLWTQDPSDLYRVNVDGTESLLQASQRAGVARFVYTSSVGALGLLSDGTPADEDTPVTLEDMVGHYKRSKFKAERSAESFVGEMAVVIVNPSTPVGELDRKPTPTGQMIVDFLRRRTPAYVRTGLNLVDVKDVAQGHLLAADRGQPGEKYILGGENLTLKQIFDTLAELSGHPSPRVRLPHAVPYAVAAVSTGLSRFTHKPPMVSLESVRMARKLMFFSTRKAEEKLGYRSGPTRIALRRAVDWFVTHGYGQLGAQAS